MAADKIPLDVGFDPNTARDSYLQLIEQMRKEGVHMVGVPNFALGDHYFKTTDHHWSSLGARKSAEAVAEYIKQLPVYADIPKMAFETNLVGEQPSKGSFTNVIKALCNIDVPPETADLFATKPRAAASDADALFGEVPKPEIVLVGTSNSKMESFDSNFEGALKFYIGADVLNKAFAGAGFDEPLYAYLASEEFQKDPPKILIWEVPGYYSTLGSNRVMDQAIALAAGPCTVPEARKDDIQIEGEDVTLFDDLKLNSTNSYVWINFEKKDIGSFHFQAVDEKGKDSSFKIRRGARYPADGVFGVVIRKRDFKERLRAVNIKVPAQAEGTSLSVSLCPLPEDVQKIYKDAAKKNKQSLIEQAKKIIDTKGLNHRLSVWN
jgi:alginate biosynthesis protein AlgX